MEIAEDGSLVCSTLDKTIARVHMDTNTVFFDASVPQIKDPHGVAIASDGSILVTDGSNKMLHLVSPQGAYTKQLWSVRSDTDCRNKLLSVSMNSSVCVCD
ncbi:hypothetical protein PoB_006706500 [Plakobranchus ocellatus]|uniref:SMP-30/Gluconolactonase/LRE-like region domain-containing protein n=1 Tax=Plakobranchus ocellatus TaxID=259542 RepID=A0AAV4D9B7_9GAST|nr:hypothetical protein PoB_006706500 [Plakobranchus ocellatus]